MPDALRLLHLSPHARGPGGLEALLRRHAQADAQGGFDAWQIGLFHGNEDGEERLTGLGFGWRDTVGGMRRALHAALAPHGGGVVVWYNAWGLPWFADLDGSRRRIVCLHGNRPYYESWLPRIQPDLDGVLVVSRSAVKEIGDVLPGFPQERIGILPLPCGNGVAAEDKGPARGPWLLGGAGRLVGVQKRWERLVPFVHELRRLGSPFRIELIGDGPLRGWLQRQLPDDGSVVFRGSLPARECQERMRAWDAALFFSDFEGGPLVLLEAMAAGALPLFPAIGGTAGDDYAAQIDPRCHYPAGDVVTAARQLHELLSLAPEEIALRRVRARSLTRHHTAEAYHDHFAAFVRRIAALPRISRAHPGRRPGWSDFLPLGLITRAFPKRLWR